MVHFCMTQTKGVDQFSATTPHTPRRVVQSSPSELEKPVVTEHSHTTTPHTQPWRISHKRASQKHSIEMHVLFVYFSCSNLLTRRNVDAAIASSSKSFRVWIDIGTSYRSLATWDLEQNSSLVVIGVDALQSNLEHQQQSKSPRLIRVEGACSTNTVKTTAFHVHASPTCGSLLPTKQGVPVLGSGSNACTGDKPRIIQVRAFRLSSLLRQVQMFFPLAHRIELLKIDVQGAELDCLVSGARELAKVDNILFEVQDVFNTSKLALYAGAPMLEDLNAFLSSLEFRLQYCEWNRWSKHIRELNCLYSRRQGIWMWATGNSRPARSMVSYDSDRPAHFDLVKHLHTLHFPGERIQGQGHLAGVRHNIHN